MKFNTEVERILHDFRNEDYHAVIKGLIEKVCSIELCEHDHIEPCRRCLLDVDNPILENLEDL